MYRLYQWLLVNRLLVHRHIIYQNGQRLCLYLLLITQLLAGCSFNAVAQNEADGALTNEQTLPEGVREVTAFYGGPNQTSSQSQPPAQVPAILQNLPAGWQQDFVTEPLWNSRMYVLQAGVKQAQTVVLVHGLGDRGVGDWLDIIPDLAQQFHVIAFDLPGFARSEKPAGRYSPENYAAIVAWLVQQYAHGPVKAVGYSMGGAITLEYAAHYPQQVERVVLVSAAGILERRALMEGAVELPVETRWLPGPLKKLGNKVGQLGRRFVEWTSVVPDPTPVIDDSDEIWLALFADYPFANAAYALSLHDFTEATQLLQKNTYLIWGSDDNTAPLRSGKLLQQKLSHAELHIINGAGHTLIATHTPVFENELFKALHATTIEDNTRHYPLPFRGSLRCENQHGITYSGRYDEVVIMDCTDVVLNDVNTEHLTISNSQVELTDVNATVEQGDALYVYNSFVKATNSTFSGPTAVFADASRLDFANTTLQSPKYALRFEKKSRVVFSLSEIASKVYTGSVHGLYSGQYLWLDDQL